MKYCPECGLVYSEYVTSVCPFCSGIGKRLSELEKRVNFEWGKAIQEEIDETHEALKVNCDLQAENTKLKQELEKYKRLVERIEKISSESPSSYFEVDKEEWQELKKEILGEKND